MKRPNNLVSTLLLVSVLALGLMPSPSALAGMPSVQQTDTEPILQFVQSRGGDAATPTPKPGNCSASSKDGKQTCQTNCKAGQVAHCTDGDPPSCVCSGG